VIPGVENPFALGILIIVGFFVGAYTSQIVVISEGDKSEIPTWQTQHS
jgi:hypothetical protein